MHDHSLYMAQEVRIWENLSESPYDGRICGDYAFLRDSTRKENFDENAPVIAQKNFSALLRRKERLCRFGMRTAADSVSMPALFRGNKCFSIEDHILHRLPARHRSRANACCRELRMK